MGKRFEGKVAIVTGGGSGIGRAACIQLADEGAKVVVVNRSKENGEETLRQIIENGGEAIFVQADVSISEEVQNYINVAIETYGKIDVLFNNAGIEGDMLPLADYPEETFDKVFAVNTKSIFLGMKYAIPHMIENGGGSIVNTASHAGVVGSPFVSAYSGSKHAVIGLTKTAVGEYSNKGIRFNVVCPGPTATAMMTRFAEALTPDDLSQTEKNVTAGIPLGHFATSEEVSKLACFLLSDDAKSITGGVHLIDGGISAL